MSDAKMSIPFAVATSIFNGRASIGEFIEDQIFKPEIQALMSAVEVRSNEEFTNRYPNFSGASIELHMADEKIKRHTILDCLGGINRTLNRESLYLKYVA